MQVPLSETLRQFDESDSVVESVGGWELSAARTTLFGASARAPEPLASPSAPRSPLVPPTDASSSLEVSASSADVEYLWLRDASGVVAVKRFNDGADRAFTFSASPLDRGKTLTPVAYGACGLWMGDSLTI